MIPQEIVITSGNLPLRASLSLPEAATGLILLAQAGGVFPGCRHEFAARIQEQAGFATLLVNLVSFRDPQNGDIHSNVPRLAQRILDCLQWVQGDAQLKDLPCAILAAGSAVPAALRAAAQRDGQVRALACRGGLPDQAGGLYLENLRAPTLLLFGAQDAAGQASGRRCLDKAGAPIYLETLEQADREFSAAPHFDAAARAAADWFRRQMPAPAAPGAPAEWTCPGQPVRI